MTLETSPWDAADLLKSKEAIATYIEAAIEDGNPELIRHALWVAACSHNILSTASP